MSKWVILPMQVWLFGRSLTNQVSDNTIIELVYKFMANHMYGYHHVYTIPPLVYHIIRYI